MIKRNFEFKNLTMEDAQLINDIVEILSTYDGYQGVLPVDQKTMYENRAYNLVSKLVDHGWDFDYNMAVDTRLFTGV